MQRQKVDVLLRIDELEKALQQSIHDQSGKLSATMTLLPPLLCPPPFYDVITPPTMTSLPPLLRRYYPPYYDVTTPPTMTSLPLYYDVITPLL